jgi:hypothetical protein
MSTAKILLAVISRAEGQISPFTALNLATLGGARDLALTIMPSPHDIVRTRSRMAHIALDGGYSHLLFWDADVSTRDPAETIRQMLAADVDLICTPYPKKSLDLAAWRNAPTLAEAQAEIYNWPVVALERENVKGLAREVGLVPMGCTLISRACLEQMAADAPWFLDDFGGKRSKPHASFMLRHVGPQLFSEDHSFCHRWRELGGSVWLNMASVCDHFGVHLYAGMVGA